MKEGQNKLETIQKALHPEHIKILKNLCLDKKQDTNEAQDQSKIIK